MPSPFPGMDPYLENAGVWPDLHNRFAEHISSMLNESLPGRYYAQLEARTEVGIGGEPRRRIIVPDVSVRHTSQPEPVGGLAVVEPRIEVSPAYDVIVETDPVELTYVEIHDAEADHAVVTLIEILSPSDKRRGGDHDRFVEKRARILASETSLIEIDLLRAGTRAWTDPTIDSGVFEVDSPADYLVAVSRSWQRRPDFRLQVFPIDLRELLPVIAVPLREDEPEFPFDLQFCFQRTYDSGPYRRGRIDYSKPPNPPLPEKDQAWAAERIAAWRAAR